MEKKYTAAEYVDIFCGYMNQKAKEIGMNASSFTNPAGTGVNNLTTSLDMAYCLIEAGFNKVIMDIWSNSLYIVKTEGQNPREVEIVSKTLAGEGTEALVNNYSIIGGKGGTLTYQRQYNSGVLAHSPDGNGVLVCVTMGAEEPRNLPNNCFEADRQALDCAVNGERDGQVCARSAVVCRMPEARGGKAEILYSKEPEKVEIPASMTKMVTALVVLDHITDLNEKIEITEEMIALVPKGYYQRYLKAGDIVTAIDLLRTLLHVSSNAAGYIFGAFVGKKLAEKEVK